jgi:hypothetical protein
MHKYKLAVGSIFKNEAHIFREWLEHYINQGVEKFYLIDNGSIITPDNKTIAPLRKIQMVRGVNFESSIYCNLTNGL